MLGAWTCGKRLGSRAKIQSTRRASSFKGVQRKTGMTVPKRKSSAGGAVKSVSCKPGECMCIDVIHGNVFTIYRCVICGKEEWL